LPVDPSEFIGEVLGVPASVANVSEETVFQCPYSGSKCSKRSTQLSDEPYPICSVNRAVAGIRQRIAVCPKRFFAADFVSDVVRECWPGEEKPSNPLVAREVQMKRFGNVDYVIADVGENGAIEQFISVELQAIDITGSVMPAYRAMRKEAPLETKPTYGLNWDNVYKRYITQLIRKGYFHHHWGTKIVAVMQDVVYDYVCNSADFMRSADVRSPSVNIIFMAYRFEDDDLNSDSKRLVLSKVEGTSHANLQQAVLYKEAPDRAAFCDRIRHSLNRDAQLDLG